MLSKRMRASSSRNRTRRPTGSPHTEGGLTAVDPDDLVPAFEQALPHLEAQPRAEGMSRITASVPQVMATVVKKARIFCFRMSSKNSLSSINMNMTIHLSLKSERLDDFETRGLARREETGRENR